jgi:hypothetical protein
VSEEVSKRGAGRIVSLRIHAHTHLNKAHTHTNLRKHGRQRAHTIGLTLARFDASARSRLLVATRRHPFLHRMRVVFESRRE